MALPIYDFQKNKLVSFSEFYELSEGIKPTKHSYGTNIECEDEVLEKFGDYYISFFIHKEQLYLVSVSSFNGEVAFGPATRGDDILDTIESLSSDNQKGKTFNNIFGYVFYIAKEMILSNNIRKFTFNGENSRLDKIYKMVVKNKNFTDSIHDMGFEYNGEKNSHHYFSKK